MSAHPSLTELNATIAAYLRRDPGEDERLVRCGCHRTKIVATIGPASESPEIIRGLLEAGMNVARLNMSHGTHADHQRRCDALRQVSRDLGRPLAILADLQGPKIRTGKLAGDQPVAWPAGKRVVITTAACPEGTAERVGTTYPGLAQDVAPGDGLLIDDGRMRLRVEAVEGTEIRLVVEIGGILRSSKGINLPGVRVSTPSLSDKDLGDLRWALANDCDYLALSFVRTAEDVAGLRHLVSQAGKRTPIIAKIEKPQAVEGIQAILCEADGIMVARGDLGIEISTERLPIVQKHLIACANINGRLVITATQMLESMIESPTPTRAESNDVANAVLDGTDAVMLSGETAVGRYPVEAVREMRRIAVEAERSPYFHQAPVDPALGGFTATAVAIAAAADQVAEAIGATAALVFTRDNRDVLLVSKFRPAQPALAFCEDEARCRRLALYWGIVPVREPRILGQEDMITAGTREAERLGLVAPTDTLLVLLGVGQDSVNAIRVVAGR